MKQPDLYSVSKTNQVCLYVEIFCSYYLLEMHWCWNLVNSNTQLCSVHKMVDREMLIFT